MELWKHRPIVMPLPLSGELAQPQGLQVITSTRSTVSLGWAPVPGATSYDIYQDGAKVGSSGESRYVAVGLEEGKTYSYKVVSHNSLWTSPESESVSVVPGSNYNNISYYTSWSASTKDRNFHPADLDISQLTHINYAFADICWKNSGAGREPARILIFLHRIDTSMTEKL